jgi:hypothetical protein
MRAGDVSRRRFVQRAGALGLSVALAEVPALLAERGLLASALAQTLDVTTDTMNALVAFVLPGDDAYSVAQGESADGPGAIAAGTTPALIRALDEYVPASAAVAGDWTIAASCGVATLLNDYALQVNPGASRGDFTSPFARLSFAEKAEVCRRFESDPALADREVRFVAGILPGFTAFLAFSASGTHRAAARSPVAWEVAPLGGLPDGHRELRGYWKGRRRALPSRFSRRGPVPG